MTEAKKQAGGIRILKLKCLECKEEKTMKWWANVGMKLDVTEKFRCENCGAMQVRVIEHYPWDYQEQ